MERNKVVYGGKTLVDLTNDTVSADKLLSGITAHDKAGAAVTGNIVSRTASDVTASGRTVTVPAGHYASQVSKSVGTAKAAATYNVSTSNQTIASGYYLTGTQTIRGVTTLNISAENIKSGVNVRVGDAGSATRIKNVTGTFTKADTVSSGQTAAAAAQIRSGYSAWVDGAEVKGSLADADNTSY